MDIDTFYSDDTRKKYIICTVNSFQPSEYSLNPSNERGFRGNYRSVLNFFQQHQLTDIWDNVATSMEKVTLYSL